MSLLVGVDLSVPSSIGLQGSEHSALSALVTEGTLSDLEVPEPPILGIRATALPVPHDSAECCIPALWKTP